MPAHVQFFLPIIDALKRLGGSASPPELKDALISDLGISEGEREHSEIFNLDLMAARSPDSPVA